MADERTRSAESVAPKWDPMDAMEEAEKLIEFAAGYRKKCEAVGFSLEVATQMAADFHRELLHKVFSA